jgi:hypothetical protein
MPGFLLPAVRRTRPWRRRMVIVLMSALLVQVGFPTGKAPVGGQFPALSKMFSWLAQSPAFAGRAFLGLPR